MNLRTGQLIDLPRRRSLHRARALHDCAACDLSDVIDRATLDEIQRRVLRNEKVEIRLGVVSPHPGAEVEVSYRLSARPLPL